MQPRTYIAIDLKSFYASVECRERGLDPMNTNLVVADESRTEKTICLAVTPALKKLGVRSRCRLFEIPPGLAYIKATPRMRLYIKYAARIYKLYLKYFSKDDIHVYSIDEVFIDVSRYLNLYGGNIPGAQGVPEEMIREAAKYGICKVNIDTDLRLAMTAEVRKFLAENPAEFDPRKYLGPGRDAIRSMVQHKIRNVLNCSGSMG